MQRALAASEPTGPPAAKAQPTPSKVFTLVGSEQKDMPILSQKEKSTESTAVKKEGLQANQFIKETPKTEAPVSTSVQRTDSPRRDSMQKTQVVSGTEQGQANDVGAQQQPVGKPPQVQSSKTTKPEGLSKQEAGKPPQQPSKSMTTPAKSVPPPAQPGKQESGSFFGFGGSKTQPTAAKPTESVTGKMFGFGSSIFSSASTLITSAVQDEPKTTPPVSPKISPAKEIKPAVAQKSQPPQQAKPAPSAKANVEKAPAEPPKATEVNQIAPKAGLTCPLCKVKLNMNSKDPPNYNTCTECKNTVCNLCGFTMPHTAVVSTNVIFTYILRFFQVWPRKKCPHGLHVKLFHTGKSQ